MTAIEAKGYGRSSVADVYRAIEEDLEAASGMLTSAYDDDNLGRATSVAAKALLAKAYLTQQKWSAAATLLDNIVKDYSSKYGLQNTVADVFDVNQEMNKEILFAVRYSKSVLGEGHGYNDYFKDKSVIDSKLLASYGNADDRKAMIEYKKVDANNNVIAKYYDTFDATTGKGWI